MVVVTRMPEYLEYLEHHGIQGQKWGVRNGPPYPLDYEQHNSSEKSKNSKGSLDNYVNNNPKSRSSGSEEHASRYKIKKKSSKIETPKQQISGDKKARKKLTPEQKEKLIKALKIGAAAAGVALVAYGSYELIKAYRGNTLIDPKTGLPLIKGPHSSADDIKAINPGVAKTFIGPTQIVDGSSMNCMLCTTTYEARRRGFDVHAGLSQFGYSPNPFFDNVFSTNDGSSVMSHIFEPESNTYAGTMKKVLEHYPEGARGNCIMYWKSGLGGHSVVWEIKNGQLVFRDGQIKVAAENVYDTLEKAKLSETAFLRTDNLNINWDYLLEHDMIRTTSNTKFLIDNLVPGGMATTGSVLGSLGALPVAALFADGKGTGNDGKKHS